MRGIEGVLPAFKVRGAEIYPNSFIAESTIYHKKFKDMRIGQAWLVKRENSLYLKAVFSKIIELLEPNNKAVAVDINENNIVSDSEKNITNIRTGERIIRTIYFLKRRNP